VFEQAFTAQEYEQGKNYLKCTYLQRIYATFLSF